MILFNHIPKTGGTTLRIIFNRVYGPERVFFINSTNIGGALDHFRSLNPEKQKQFKVISGHGASLFKDLVDAPFIVTILRDPLALFLSQYYYLKSSDNSTFRREMSKLGSLEDYLFFAKAHGQDNLLTRYISEEIDWLARPELPIPDLKTTGNAALEKAKTNLKSYPAVLSLENLDMGIYGLKQKLNWSRIPFYRRYNKTPQKPLQISADLRGEIKKLLQPDLELYDYFHRQQIDIAKQLDPKDTRFRWFIGIRSFINWMGI